MQCTYFSPRSSQEEQSIASTYVCTPEEESWIPYPNGLCPPNCTCVHLYWDDCCEAIQHLVEDYEDMLRSMPAVLPPTARPSRKRLVDAVSYAYWDSRRPDMNCVDESAVDMNQPLPDCMSGVYANITAIQEDFDALELKRDLHLRQVLQHAPIDVDAQDDEDIDDEATVYIKQEDDDHGSNSLAIRASPIAPPTLRDHKKLRQQSLTQAFSLASSTQEGPPKKQHKKQKK